MPRLKKMKPRKTVRRRRRSTSGKVKLPLDVRSDNDLPNFLKALQSKKLTIILVYATWCPHCHTIMPHFDAASKNPNNTVSSVKINETMVNNVNNFIKSNVNSSAKPINVEGYPSIIIVNNKGDKITDIEPVKNTETLTKVMENAGPLAEEANLNKSNTFKNAVNSMNLPLKNVGVENKGLANRSYNASIKNIDELSNNVKVAKESKEAKEAKEIISLQAPNSLNSMNSSLNIKPVMPPLPDSPLPNSDMVHELEPVNRLSGGRQRKQGGNLMSAMAKTAYTLAPSALLLATASGMKKTHTRSKKQKKRKTHRIR